MCRFEAELQLSAGFIPGKVAEAHVGVVASHIISAISGLGLFGDPVAELTKQLGET